MQKNFIYYLLPSITVGVLGTLITVPITTYYLDPKDFGVFAILTAVTTPMGPLSSTGISWVLAGNYFKLKDHERRTLVFNTLLLELILKFFWVLVFWSLSPVILPLVIKDFELRYIFYFKLCLISFFLNTFWLSISYFIVLRGDGFFHAIIEISRWVVGALATIICLVVLKLSTVTLFIAPLISGVITFVLGVWYVKGHVTCKIRKKWFPEIFKVGMVSIPSNLVEMLTNISDRYFIQKWMNLSHLGIYSHSQNYKNFFNMGGKAFNRTLEPYSLEIYSKGLDSKLLEQKLKKWYGLLGIAGIFTTLFSYEIVKVLTHGKFVNAAPLIPIWFTLILSYAYGLPYTQFLFVHKKNTFMMYSGVIISTVFIGIVALSIFHFGMFGATISVVISNFAIQIFRRIYALKLGCSKVGENHFIFVLLSVAGVYLLNMLIPFNIFHKIVILSIFTILFLTRYDLTGIIRANYQKAINYFPNFGRRFNK